MTTKTWRTAPYMWLGLTVSLVLVAGFAVWASLAQIGGAILANGQIEVDQNRQVIQHPFGGQVGEILVTEGQTVTQGQVLITLDPVELTSELAVTKSQLSELIARRSRLIAERDGLSAIEIDPTLGATDAIEGQERLFQARLASDANEKAQFERRKSQIADQIAGIQAQQASIRQQLALIEQELADQQSLLDRGLAQASRVLALQREQASLSGRIGELTASAAQAEGRRTEIDLSILAIDTRRREEAITQLRDLEPQILELTERSETLANRLDALEVKAPVSGVVYALQFFSNAAVIRQAEPIMYIVPQDRPLIITAQVNPRDIDQISQGQPVTLRFSAFDQRRTPELTGYVTNFSADAFQDQQTGASYYRTEIVLSEGEQSKLPEGAQLIPGMPVEALIRTDDRTPIEFLTQPLTDFFARAFRES